MSTGQSPQFNLRLPGGQEFGPATLELLEQLAREGRMPPDALLAPQDGSPVRSIFSEPRLRAVLQAAMTLPPAAPPTSPQPLPPQPDSGMAVMIPYKNQPALIGYYMAVASLIPGVGLLTGPIAVGLGIAGLRKRLKHPEVHGIAHAWIAIILGAMCTIGYAGLIVWGIVAAANS
jgi:hypothetical protein